MGWITCHDNEESKIVNDSNILVPEKQLVASLQITNLDHKCALNIYSLAAHVRLTGIIATIGAACRNEQTIEDMIENGMNIARVICSSNTQTHQAESIRMIRAAAERYSNRINMICPVAVCLDLKGPEIRTGYFEGGPGVEVILKKGDYIKITTDQQYMNSSTNEMLYIDYENFPKFVFPGCQIYVDMGLILLKCKYVYGSSVHCFIEMGGKLKSYKEVNIPGVKIDLPAITEKDKDDIRFAVEQHVDILCISFVRNADVVNQVKTLLGEKGKYIKIVSKIECSECLYNLDEIIQMSDAVLVARGDLGVQIPLEKVFVAQKTIIARCNKAGVPVICARHMLESMIRKLRPTRAESSDVANAILDGADCLQLTTETIEGQHPVECIKMMAQICKEAEAAYWQHRIFIELSRKVIPPIEQIHALSIAAVEAATKLMATAIIVVTVTGKSARQIAHYRPRCPIVAVTRNFQIARQLQLHRAIFPYIFLENQMADDNYDVETQLDSGIKFCIKTEIIKPLDNVILITKTKSGDNYLHTMRILSVQDDEASSDEDILSL